MKKKWVWIVGVLVVLVIIGSIVGGDEGLEAERATAETRTEEPVSAEQMQGAPTEPRPSIGKERSDFQWHYEMTEDIEFQEGVTSEGIEVVEGTGKDVAVQIVGPEDAVEQISVTWFMVGGTSDVALQKLGIIGFMTDFGLKENNWVMEQIDQRGFESPWSVSNTMGSLKISVSFDPEPNNRPLQIIVSTA